MVVVARRTDRQGLRGKARPVGAEHLTQLPRQEGLSLGGSSGGDERASGLMECRVCRGEVSRTEAKFSSLGRLVSPQRG